MFAFNGDVIVDGRVDDDVTALNGRVVVTETGSVGGDVVSGDPPVIAQRSSVAGDVDRARDRFALGDLGAVGLIVLWIALTVSTFLLGGALLLVTPRGADAVARAGRTSVGPAIGLGFAIAIGVPIVGVLLSISIVALPLGLATLFALAFMYGVGYVAGCYFLGRLILRSPGTACSRSWWAGGSCGSSAIVPVLGGLVSAAAVVYGLGCITVAVFRARRAAPRAADEPPRPSRPTGRATGRSRRSTPPETDADVADADWQDHRSISVSCRACRLHRGTACAARSAKRRSSSSKAPMVRCRAAGRRWRRAKRNGGSTWQI